MFLENIFISLNSRRKHILITFYLVFIRSISFFYLTTEFEFPK